MNELQELLRQLRIAPDDWDALIICDGSASRWDDGHKLGWGSRLYQREVIEPRDFWGGASAGTNNCAELLAVLHPLLYLESLKAGVRDHGYRVWVISDSQYVVGGINARPDMLTFLQTITTNRSLWYGLYGATRGGLILQGKHVGRSDVTLHQLMHRLANGARKGTWDVSQDPALSQELQAWE